MSDESPRIDIDGVEHFFRDEWLGDCGKRVRSRRDELGLSLAKTKRLSGVSKTTWSKVERGAMHPSDKLKVVIAHSLCVDVHELWPWPEPRRILQVAGNGVAA